MKNITGPPVIGDDFYGREAELAYVWKKMESGNNFILPSPRRVGKTSFALKLVDTANQKGWNCVSLNLEKVANEQDFIVAFITELKKLSWWTRLKEKGSLLAESLGSLKPTIAYGDASIQLEWQKKKGNIYKQLAELLNHQESTIIFFDELTVLLTAMVQASGEGVKEVTNFLHWLRDLRIQSGSKIRWLFCSSVGIENFTHRHRISDALNDVHEYELKSYTELESVKMLMKLGKDNNVSITTEIADAVVKKLEYCLPFFLQISYEKIDLLSSVDNETLDVTIVNKAYDMLTNENHFNTWIERITSQYEMDTDSAFVILKHLSQAAEGSTRENLINILAGAGVSTESAESTVSRLLYMLKNDGYLLEVDRKYRFRSPLLKGFWYSRFVK